MSESRHDSPRLPAGLALLEHYLYSRFAVCPDLRPQR